MLCYNFKCMKVSQDVLNEHRNFQEPSSSFFFFMKLFITEVNAEISQCLPTVAYVCVAPSNAQNISCLMKRKLINK